MTQRRVRTQLLLLMAAFLPAVDTAGTPQPVGGEFQVNTYTKGYQAFPVVALDGAGGFVVVWLNSTDTLDVDIRARLYDPAGLPLGDEFQVDTYTTSYQYIPAVAADPSGGFVVVWKTARSSSPPWDWIVGQRFHSDGTPLNDEFQVSSYSTNFNRRPQVSADGNNGFIVTWEGWSPTGNDPNLSILAREFSSDGNPVGNEFQVNTYTTVRQSAPTVSTDGGHGFIISWDSWGGITGGDPISSSILAQRFLANSIFVDGFESGDLSAWSVTNP